METIDGNTITTETLRGVSSSFTTSTDDSSHKILKPSLEESGGEDLGLENEVLCDNMTGGGGGATVVVTTTVIETTEISVVEKKMIKGDKEDKEDGKKGYFGNLVGDGDENMVFVDAKGSFSGSEVSEVNAMGIEKQENQPEIFEGEENEGNSGEKKPENVDKSDHKSENQEKSQDSGEEPKSENQEKGQDSGMELAENENPKSENQENCQDSGMELAGKEDPKSENQENWQDSGMELAEKEKPKSENQETGQDSGKELAENEEPKSEKQENFQDSGMELAENERDYDGERDETEEEEEDHDFVIGDFVWGKIKSHPWWPGQIYDPSDASDYAATLKRKGHLLVAYFGDGSFSWCSPSQLKPFIDSFEEMSNQSDSKKFVNAVQKSLEAVGSLVEAEMVCKCQTVDRVGDGQTAAVAVNSGIKAGVGMPKGNTIKVLIDRMNPVELFSTLRAFATMELGVKMGELELELVVLKSCLTGFYRRKNGQRLPEYHDPMYIEGLEDKSKSGFVSDSDINGPSESGDGKIHQKRKQKSVAELLGEGGEIKKLKTGGGGGGSGSRSLKKERKRKPLVVSVSPESDHDSGGGGGGGGGIEEETMSPRQRKKSKYLSPPYTSPIWAGKHSGSFKMESEKVPEMAAKHLEDSLKRNSSGKRTRSRPRQQQDGFDSQDSKEEEEEKEKEKAMIDGAVNVNKVLEGLLRAALDPSGFVEKKKKKVPEVSEFVSAFRNSVFENGKKPVSDLEFIEWKLESMREMVKGCEEGEMSEGMKGSLEEGFKEVLEKVGKMK